MSVLGTAAFDTKNGAAVTAKVPHATIHIIAVGSAATSVWGSLSVTAYNLV